MDAHIYVPPTIFLTLHSLAVRWQTKEEKKLLKVFIYFLQWIMGRWTTEKWHYILVRFNSDKVSSIICHDNLKILGLNCLLDIFHLFSQSKKIQSKSSRKYRTTEVAQNKIIILSYKYISLKKRHINHEDKGRSMLLNKKNTATT